MDEIRVLGLTRLESLDLKREFPDADIRFETAPTKDQESGELATVAVIILALAGIKALAAWLLKHQKHGKISHYVTVTNRKGESRTERFEMDVTESISQADVVKQLATLMKVDPSVLKG